MGTRATQAGSVFGLLDIVLAPTPQFQAGLGSGAGFPWSSWGGGGELSILEPSSMHIGYGELVIMEGLITAYRGGWPVAIWDERREGDFASLLLLSTPAPRYLGGVLGAPLTVAWPGSLLCRHSLARQHARTTTSALRASAELVGFEIHGEGKAAEDARAGKITMSMGGLR